MQFPIPFLGADGAISAGEL